MRGVAVDEMDAVEQEDAVDFEDAREMLGIDRRARSGAAQL